MLPVGNGSGGGSGYDSGYGSGYGNGYGTIHLRRSCVQDRAPRRIPLRGEDEMNTETDMETSMKTIEVNGVKYVREQPNGNRCVVVVDRGWIFAGDVTEKDGRIILDRAVWVFRWERIGFAAVVADPTQKGVDIRPLTTRVDVPAGAEVFRLPVADDWGL